MFECVSLGIVFALMIYLIRRRVDVSYALVAGAAALGLLFGVRWEAFPRGFGHSLVGIARNLGKAATARETLELAGVVLLIQFLGHALRHAAHLDRLMAALRGVLRDPRAALAAAPAFVGLLPMPGGALFSAPMVDELARGLELPAADRTLINYWFRHIWEWTWPLYPGILFASAIVRAPLGTTILATSPFTLGAIAIGAGFLARRVKLSTRASGERSAAPAASGWGELFAAAWPVTVVVLITAVLAVAKFTRLPLGLPTQTALLVSLAIVNPLFLAVNHVPWRDVGKLARATLQPTMVLLVYGVLAFGHMLDAYGAAAELPRIFAAWGVPPVALLFAVPLIVGLFTGYMPAAVGICFPVLVPLIVEGASIRYGRMAFAYAGGLFGVFLSPVHLCLVLSREYFKADFGEVYRLLFRMMAFLAVVAVGTLVLWEAVGLR